MYVIWNWGCVGNTITPFLQHLGEKETGFLELWSTERFLCDPSMIPLAQAYIGIIVNDVILARQPFFRVSLCSY